MRKTPINENIKTEYNMLDKDVTYSITINPNNEKQYFYNINRVRNINKHFTNNYFKPMADHGIIFEIYPELSTPDQNRPYRYHWHGTIKFNGGLEKWYIDIHNRMVRECNIDIDTIENMDVWKDYCTKNKSLIHGLVKHSKVKHYKISNNNVLEYN